MNVIREAMKNLPGHWCKGAITDGHGNYCGIGHARNVAEDLGEMWNMDTIPTWAILMHEVAGEQYPDRASTYDPAGLPSSFVLFNDHPDTTEEEVLAVMEKAAIKLEEQIG